MKNRTLHLLLVLLNPLLGGSAAAVSDSQYQAIRELGTRNGTALGCGYFDEVKRIKEALVVRLPKRRELGRVFEDSTNRAYLDSIARKSVCPDAGSFRGQVNQSLKSLDRAYGGGSLSD